MAVPNLISRNVSVFTVPYFPIAKELWNFFHVPFRLVKYFRKPFSSSTTYVTLPPNYFTKVSVTCIIVKVYVRMTFRTQVLLEASSADSFRFLHYRVASNSVHVFCFPAWLCFEWSKWVRWASWIQGSDELFGNVWKEPTSQTGENVNKISPYINIFLNGNGFPPG